MCCGRKEAEYIFKCFAKGNILSHGFPAEFLFALGDVTAVFRMGGESLLLGKTKLANEVHAKLRWM